MKKLKETFAFIQQLDKNMSNLRTWLARIESELSKPVVYDVCDNQEIQKRLAEQQVSDRKECWEEGWHHGRTSQACPPLPCRPACSHICFPQRKQIPARVSASCVKHPSLNSPSLLHSPFGNSSSNAKDANLNFNGQWDFYFCLLYLTSL